MRAACICFALSLACAQSPSFEAVSLKPFPEGAPIQYSGCMGGPGSDDPGRIQCEYVTLKVFLQRAYKLRPSEILGPSWLDGTHFNIQAKLPAGATKEQVPAMFAALLTERFHVESHRETRPLTAYALTVAKNGPKLSTAAPPPPDAPKPIRQGEDGFPILPHSSIASGPIILYRQGRARLMAAGCTTAKLADSLANQLDSTVTDETALAGSYDITLTWTPAADERGGNAPTPSADTDLPDNLFVALERQLGLKLTARKSPREVLIVDRADKTPTAN